MSRRAPGLLLTALLAAASARCTPPVDVTKGIQVLDVSTGWYDAGITSGQNKLVPSITFKLKNLSNQKLAVLQVMASFKRVAGPGGEPVTDEWRDGASDFRQVVGSASLPPGQISPSVTLRSPLGYTGTDPRLQMLQSKSFVDAKADLFVKYGSTEWTRVGEYPVERHLLTN
jgi:hypothetical protein